MCVCARVCVCVCVWMCACVCVCVHVCKGGRGSVLFRFVCVVKRPEIMHMRINILQTFLLVYPLNQPLDLFRYPFYEMEEYMILKCLKLCYNYTCTFVCE